MERACTRATIKIHTKTLHRAAKRQASVSSDTDPEQDTGTAAPLAATDVRLLPAGGGSLRFNMKIRLADVAWDPRQTSRLALVGSDSHEVHCVDFGKVWNS